MKNDAATLLESEMFVGKPGRAGFTTHVTVRSATYRIATFIHMGRNLDVPPRFQVVHQKIPAGRLARYLRQLSTANNGRDNCGWVIVSAHRKSPVPRVFLMHIGMTDMEARQAIQRQEEQINQYLRFLAMPSATTRRLLLDPDQIETELGVDVCRRLWRGVRVERPAMAAPVLGETLGDVSGRSSKGHAMVSVHPEIMTVCGECKSFNDAVNAVKVYLRKKTLVRSRIRDIEAYLRHAWPVARVDILRMEEIERKRAHEGRPLHAGRPTLRVVNG